MRQDFPHTGYQFRVSFLIPGLSTLGPVESHFQSVSGLSGGYSPKPYAAGGIAGYSHQLTERSSYGPLVLAKGMTSNQALQTWCETTFLTMRTIPVNVLISLLGKNQEPLENWMVLHAIPTKFNTSGFDAKSSNVVVETMTLSYHHYIRI